MEERGEPRDRLLLLRRRARAAAVTAQPSGLASPRSHSFPGPPGWKHGCWQLAPRRKGNGKEAGGASSERGDIGQGGQGAGGLRGQEYGSLDRRAAEKQTQTQGSGAAPGPPPLHQRPAVSRPGSANPRLWTAWARRGAQPRRGLELLGQSLPIPGPALPSHMGVQERTSEAPGAAIP